MRFSEFEDITNDFTEIGCLFDIGGQIDAFLGYSARVGWPPFGKKWKGNFARTTLSDFAIPLCSQSSPGTDIPLIPILADAGPANFPGGVLELNLGTRAAQRQHLNTADGSEVFQLTGSAQANSDRITVAALGHTQDYAGVSKLTANAGEGNDLISTVLEETDAAGNVLTNEDGEVLGFIDTVAVPVEFSGGNGDDVLYGGTSSDILNGDAGKDRLFGRGGNDSLSGGGDEDLLEGGEGQDNIQGGDGNDTLAGNSGADTIDGGAGDDFIEGGSDSDILYGDSENSQAGNDVIFGDDGDDQLFGRAGADILNGGSGSDHLEGGAGNDELLGEAGDDRLHGGVGNDNISGGDGVDTVSYDDSPNSVFVNIDEGRGYKVPSALASLYPIRRLKAGKALDGFGTVDRFAFSALRESFDEETEDILTETTRISGELENIVGSRAKVAGDILIGNSQDNQIQGLEGNDLLDGRAGNDFMLGDGGRDTLRGEAGYHDRMFGGADDDTILDPDGVDGAHGDEGDDKITVTFDSDWADPNGRRRSDGRITGGDGDDTITVTMNHDDFFINLKGDRPGVSTPKDGNDTITLKNTYAVSVVELGGGDDTFNGGMGNDSISGGSGNDDIFSSSGSDVLKGEAGYHDRMFGGKGDDTILDPDGVNSAHGDEGNDTIEVTFDSDWADPNGRRRSDGRITGGTGDDTITVTMNHDDFFINLKGDRPNGDTSGDGNDIVTLKNTYAVSVVDLGSGDDIFNGGMGNDTVSGSRGNDFMLGDDGHDWLDGGRGKDTILAGAGNDTVAGGLGQDTLDGGDGDDVLRGDLNIRSGHLRGTSIAVTAIGDDDIIYGGAGQDRIGGKGGNDRLYGGDDDDQIWGDDGDDLLWGGMGDDRLTGDDFSGGQGSDTFVLAAGEGTDTIIDYEIGIDLIGLANGLTFGQLSINQRDRNALIGFANDTLAVLNNVTASALTENAFVTI
ncbi:MAG: hypothetical protein F6J97_17085 [Leptolyngbya sp. SIO4C1]|nr:hypothetical protein [Leptolyngbya sp. SIO4C1]